MNGRTHFVYEAFDADGLLLYVGCTGNPGARYRAHMKGDPGGALGWFHPFVTHWQVSGPYPKPTALRIERERIAERQPIWNGNRRPEIDGYLRSHGVQFVPTRHGSRPVLAPVRKRQARVAA